MFCELGVAAFRASAHSLSIYLSLFILYVKLITILDKKIYISRGYVKAVAGVKRLVALSVVVNRCYVKLYGKIGFR